MRMCRFRGTRTRGQRRFGVEMINICVRNVGRTRIVVRSIALIELVDQRRTGRRIESSGNGRIDRATVFHLLQPFVHRFSEERRSARARIVARRPVVRIVLSNVVFRRRDVVALHGQIQHGLMELRSRQNGRIGRFVRVRRFRRDERFERTDGVLVMEMIVGRANTRRGKRREGDVRNDHHRFDDVRRIDFLCWQFLRRNEPKQRTAALVRLLRTQIDQTGGDADRRRLFVQRRQMALRDGKRLLRRTSLRQIAGRRRRFRQQMQLIQIVLRCITTNLRRCLTWNVFLEGGRILSFGWIEFLDERRETRTNARSTLTRVLAAPAGLVADDDKFSTDCD